MEVLSIVRTIQINSWEIFKLQSSNSCFVDNFGHGTDLFEIGSDAFNDDDNRRCRYFL